MFTYMLSKRFSRLFCKYSAERKTRVWLINVIDNNSKNTRQACLWTKKSRPIQVRVFAGQISLMFGFQCPKHFFLMPLRSKNSKICTCFYFSSTKFRTLGLRTIFVIDIIRKLCMDNRYCCHYKYFLFALTDLTSAKNQRLLL